MRALSSLPLATDTPMSIYSRPVVLLLSGLFLLTLSIAMLNTLVPLWLAREQLLTWQIGLVTTAFFAGNLVGTLIAGWGIKKWGFRRCYYLALVLFAVGAVGLGINIHLSNWLVWRFIAGIGCAAVWVVAESALLCTGTPQHRGRLLAAYMMVYYLGTVLGQLMLTRLTTELAQMLPWVTALTVAAALPLLFTRLPAQHSEQQGPTALRALQRQQPVRLGINGCVISGIILGSLYGLMPLYLNHQGMNDAHIGFWMAAMIGAGIMGQWPVERLAARFGRLWTLRIQLLVVILGALVMLQHTASKAAIFMLGAAAFTLYPIAMAWACEKVAKTQLVAMNQLLLLSYTIGSLIGPSLAAMLMQRYSDDLLFIVLASVSFAYLMMLLHSAKQRQTPVAHA